MNFKVILVLERWTVVCW